MNAANDIVKELQELNSPLAQWPRVMPFAVPEGYFSSFPVQSLMATADPVLNFSKSMPFEVPQGYFEALTARIMDAVEQPAFGRTQQTPFAVPEGYFAGMAGKMLAAAKAADAGPEKAVPAQKATKIIELRPQWKAIRWAAAAMLVLGIGIGSFMKFGQGESQPAATRQLAQLDKNIIDSYVQQNIDDFDTELLTENNAVFGASAEKNIHKLDKKDIIQYLDDDAGWNENGG